MEEEEQEKQANDAAEKEGVGDIPQLQLTPAALPARFMAFFLDYLMVFAIFYLVTTSFLYPVFHPGFADKLQEFWQQQQQSEEAGFREMLQQQLDFQIQNERAIADTQFVFIIVIWMYFAVSEIVLRGTTLGKKTFKLVAIDLKTLKRPGGKTILIRNCLKTICVTLVFPLLLINFFVPFFNRLRLAGHDFLSKTMVTYEGSVPLEEKQVP